MKIIRVIGGLGNQMFQYAFYLSLLKKDKDCAIDILQMENYKLHNGYELQSIFQIQPNVASLKDVKKLSLNRKNNFISKVLRKTLRKKRSEYLEKENFTFDKGVYGLEGDVYLQGYWQNEKYFENIRKEVLETFSFNKPLDNKNETILRRILNSNSVSIHVRRGDYLKHEELLNICTLDYYLNAINYFKNKEEIPIFYIFSNDIEWCKENFKTMNINCEYIDWNRGNDSYKDMQLMSNCKHNIIANSSFSWWGAWLNQNLYKIVITPSKWTNKTDRVDIIPENWIKMNSIKC